MKDEGSVTHRQTDRNPACLSVCRLDCMNSTVRILTSPAV